MKVDFFGRQILLLVVLLITSIMPVLGQNSWTWGNTTYSADNNFSFDGGSGTETDPFIIASEGTLAQLAANVNSGYSYSNKYILVTHDLDMAPSNTSAYNWIGIGDAISMTAGNSGLSYGNINVGDPFQGHFDGGGHTINLYYYNTESTPPHIIGLFGYLGAGATVDNVIVNGNITSKWHTGGIAGFVQGTGINSEVRITRCANYANLTSTGSVSNDTRGNTGGMVGYSYNTTLYVDQCYNVGNLTNSRRGMAMVGLVSKNNTKLYLSNCYNYGTLPQETDSKTAGQFTFGARTTSIVHISNCFTLPQYVTTITAGWDVTAVDSADYFNGSLAWRMNTAIAHGTPANYVWAHGGDYPVFANIANGIYPTYRAAVVNLSTNTITKFIYTDRNRNLIDNLTGVYFYNITHTLTDASQLHFTSDAELYDLSIGLYIINDSQISGKIKVGNTYATTTSTGPIYHYTFSVNGDPTPYSFYASYAWEMNGTTLSNTSHTLNQTLVLGSNYHLYATLMNDIPATLNRTLSVSRIYKNVVYVSDANGDDNYSGLSYAAPKKTLLAAYSILPISTNAEENEIVIMDEVSATDLWNLNFCRNVETPPLYAKNVTLTAKGPNEWEDYIETAKLKFPKTGNYGNYYFWGDVIIHDLVIKGVDQGEIMVYMQGHDLTIGDNVSTQGFKNIATNLSLGTITIPNHYFKQITICAGWRNYNNNYLSADNLPYEQGHVSHISIMSGTFGRLIGSGRNDADEIRSDPHNNAINLNSKNIFGHADKPWGVELNVGGTAQVNLIAAGQCDGTIYSNVVVNISDNAVVGRLTGGNIAYARYLAGVPSNNYFGTSTINISGGDVFELYGGSLGRSPSNTPDSTFYYGHITINISGGAIHNNIYGCGAGGVSGYDPHNGDHHMDWGLNFLQGDTTTISINISSNAVIDSNVYGAGYGLSKEFLNTIAAHSYSGTLFGNSSVNISGGTIAGSVYGGGKGYLYPSITVGSVTYSAKDSTARLVGNTYVTVSDSALIKGNVYGGSEGVDGYPSIAEITGNTYVTLKGGHVQGNVFGGCNLAPLSGAPLKGNTFVLLKDSIVIDKNIYGGGDQALVTGNSHVQIGE